MKKALNLGSGLFLWSGKQMDAVLAILQKAVLAQSAHFGGKSAAVHFQIVRQTLAVEGNGEPGGAGFLGLHQKVGHQLFPAAAD